MLTASSIISIDTATLSRRSRNRLIKNIRARDVHLGSIRENCIEVLLPSRQFATEPFDPGSIVYDILRSFGD